MAATPSSSMTEETLQGFKYFRVLAPLLASLRPIGTERDRAGNRQLFYHQYASWLLVYFFTPVVTSLRGLHQTTTLAQVQERLGGYQTSLSTLREAAYIFDATLLHEVLTRGADHAGSPPAPASAAGRAGRAGPVDRGRWQPLAHLAALAWVLWQDDQQRAAKRPVVFAVLSQGPVAVTVTAGNGSERAEWRRLVQPGG